MQLRNGNKNNVMCRFVRGRLLRVLRRGARPEPTRSVSSDPHERAETAANSQAAADDPLVGRDRADVPRAPCSHVEQHLRVVRRERRPMRERARAVDMVVGIRRDRGREEGRGEGVEECRVREGRRDEVAISVK